MKWFKKHGDRLIDMLLKDDQLEAAWNDLFTQVSVLVRCTSIIIEHITNIVVNGLLKFPSFISTCYISLNCKFTCQIKINCR